MPRNDAVEMHNCDKAVYYRHCDDDVGGRSNLSYVNKLSFTPKKDCFGIKQYTKEHLIQMPRNDAVRMHNCDKTVYYRHCDNDEGGRSNLSISIIIAKL